jgi:hypothetical protein
VFAAGSDEFCCGFARTSIMDKQQVFEARLTSALQRYVGDDQPHVDPMALARAIVAESPRGLGWAGLRTWRLPRVWRSPYVAVGLALLVLLAIIGATVGSRVLLQVPTPSVLPTRGIFTPTGTLAVGRHHAAAAALPDGRVLITGGFPSVRVAELWDPAVGAFTPAGELVDGRWGHTSTVLSDGRVLVAGGVGVNSGGITSMLFSAELWDPATMTFSATGSPSGGHLDSMARLLADGRVLISGGSLLTAGPSAAPEVWDPTTGQFSPGNDIPGARAPAGAALDGNRVLWRDGSVLSVWDPATGTSQAVAAVAEPVGVGSSLTLLPDGRVLVLGGSLAAGGELLATAQIVDPSRDIVERTGSLIRARQGHAAVLSRDGRVLVVGGDAADGRSAEIYEPP